MHNIYTMFDMAYHYRQVFEYDPAEWWNSDQARGSRMLFVRCMDSLSDEGYVIDLDRLRLYARDRSHVIDGGLRGVVWMLGRSSWPEIGEHVTFVDTGRSTGLSDMLAALWPASPKS